MYRTERAEGSDTVVRGVGRNPRESVVLKTVGRDSDHGMESYSSQIRN